MLETISLYDEPALRVLLVCEMTKNGELLKKSSASQYFRKLMEAVSRKCKVVVISYSSDGIIDTIEMMDLLSSMGKLEIREKEYKNLWWGRVIQERLLSTFSSVHSWSEYMFIHGIRHQQ